MRRLRIGLWCFINEQWERDRKASRRSLTRDLSLRTLAPLRQLAFQTGKRAWSVIETGKCFIIRTLLWLILPIAACAQRNSCSQLGASWSVLITTFKGNTAALAPNPRNSSPKQNSIDCQILRASVATSIQYPSAGGWAIFNWAVVLSRSVLALIKFAAWNPRSTLYVQAIPDHRMAGVAQKNMHTCAVRISENLKATGKNIPSFSLSMPPISVDNSGHPNPNPNPWLLGYSIHDS